MAKKKTLWTIKNLDRDMVEGFIKLCGKSGGTMDLEKMPDGSFTAVCSIDKKKDS
ncbi:hypothetical protein [Phaeobacter sp. 11ANDIMAR09]|uniref:hypothetical protein n=1 Tax=Phaeobacter sp. 11ANDIMAR09 TaxID=1225647 RepID=UPI000B15911B|nr:hypothetical protein [Phaeobacter sp. 11ANDIMAR09]